MGALTFVQVQNSAREQVVPKERADKAVGARTSSDAELSDVLPYLGSEPWHAGPLEPDQQSRQLSGLLPIDSDLLVKDIHGQAWEEVELVEQEAIRVNGSDLVVLERVIGEVPGVERDDDLGVGADRSGEHVPIFRVIGHDVDL